MTAKDKVVVYGTVHEIMSEERIQSFFGIELKNTI